VLITSRGLQGGGDVRDSVQYGDLIFDKSLLFARRQDGEELKFTRAERLMLVAFTSNIRKPLTRSQLLDALSDSVHETSDRNVDYLINRLRAKLGDSARSPSMIATQYGEGYVWIAEPIGTAFTGKALLVMGPVFGLEHAASAQRVRSLLLLLQKSIDLRTADDQKIALDEGWKAESATPGNVRFSLDMSFYHEGSQLHCAALLRDAATRQMLSSFRWTFNLSGPTGIDIDAVAQSVKHAMWQQLTTGQGALAGPTDTPLELRMHNASRLFMRSDESWAQMGEQLASAREEKPGDPETDLMWAMHLYTRIVTAPQDIGKRNEIESEIEALVFDHLPAFQENPIFVLGAAKLLLFVGRGHLGMAEQMAEQAFASSAAFASSFAVLGQIRMCRGDITAAVDLYDRGIELSQSDTEFQVFLMVLKCVALLATGDREALDLASEALYALKPVTRYYVGLSVAPLGPLAPDLNMMVSQYDAARAAQGITYLYYIFARLFEREDHRENVMRGLISHLTQRFGTEIVSDEVWRCVPRLIEGRNDS
jgi:DNA-binding winged helix-turn-helix (wHTH) protein